MTQKGFICPSYVRLSVRMYFCQTPLAHRSCLEVTGWIDDRGIRVKFQAYPNRVRGLRRQGGEKTFRTSHVCVGVGLTRKRPLVAHVVDAR